MHPPERIGTRQYDVGYCAICEQYGELTDDHVFLHAVGGSGRRELRTLVPTAQPRVVQGGVKYRTICESCNSEILGNLYDPELVRLCKQVSEPVETARKTGLLIPSRVGVRYKPMRVARSVVGHSLAAHLIQDVNVPPKQKAMPMTLREFVLNDRLDLPRTVEIYWWFYPSNHQVAINYCGMLRLGWHQAILGSFLKFFPFAFWIVFNRPEQISINVPHLVPRGLGLDDEIDQTFSLACPFHVHWPEKPGPNDMLLLCDRATVAARPWPMPRH
jgi:hypothetical protein